MVSVLKFLEEIEAIAATSPEYRLGGSGKDGTCDCIGLIIGAVERAGEAWFGTHGSNYAARYKTNALKPIEADKLSLGDIVYKSLKPGELNWALPSTYKDHPDQLDYYHVGVVTSIEPLIITHCSIEKNGTSIHRDKKIGNWKWQGKLSLLNYGDEEEGFEKDMKATVITESSSSVRMRKYKSTSSQILCNVPTGSTVTVKNKAEDWCQIRYNGMEGYMATQHLLFSDEHGPNSTDEELRSLILNKLEEIENGINKLIKLLTVE